MLDVTATLLFKTNAFCLIPLHIQILLWCSRSISGEAFHGPLFIRSLTLIQHISWVTSSFMFFFPLYTEYIYHSQRDLSPFILNQAFTSLIRRPWLVFEFYYFFCRSGNFVSSFSIILHCRHACMNLANTCACQINWSKDYGERSEENREMRLPNMTLYRSSYTILRYRFIYIYISRKFLHYIRPF